MIFCSSFSIESNFCLLLYYIGPAGYWWASKGDKQSPQGLKIPDENGSSKPLRRYGGETIVITLPDNKTIYDCKWYFWHTYKECAPVEFVLMKKIVFRPDDYLGVWCEEYFVDFGHTRIPHNIL